MDHKGRQQRLQNSLSTHRLDALLITHPANLRYLCGFTGSSGALLLTGTKKRVFITDGRYTEQARAEVGSAQIVIARQPLAAAAAWLSAQQKKGRRTPS
jgi:Xaa-Pro aminopeptidase